jgi:hypothetical protein
VVRDDGGNNGEELKKFGDDCNGGVEELKAEDN